MSAVPEGLVQTKEGFYVLERDTHLSRWVEEHGRLDVAAGQIDFFKRFIPVGGVVVDAGASLGDHTLTYAKLVGPTGHVFAFEPHPLSFQALQLNFEAWKNVQTSQCALSDHLGEYGMTLHENAGMSFLGLDAVGHETVTVRCQYLDYALAGIHRLDFIHLDCEGWEVKVLSGARGLIARHRPVIVLEINHVCLARVGLTEDDVLRAIKEMGYGWEEIEPHLSSDYVQRDIICHPK